MRLIYVVIIISTLMGTLLPYPVKAEEDFIIEGVLRNGDTGSALAFTDISLTNNRTNETIYSSTDSVGSFSFDLDDFENGWQYGDFVDILGSRLNMDGYPCRIQVHGMEFGNTMYMEPMLYPNQDNPTLFNDTAVVEAVTNRGLHENDFNWLIDDTNKTRHVEDQVTIISIHLAYDWWDDGQGIPCGENRTIKLIFYLDCAFMSDPNQILDHCDIEETYNVTGSEGQQYKDPLVPYFLLSYARIQNQDLYFHGKITCAQYYRNNLTEIRTESIDDEISGISYTK